jgi:hypothetical protein
MVASAMFPRAARASGMYESFYVRAVHPGQPLGVWIRYTAHKRPGARAAGALWFTLFDARSGPPVQQKAWGELTVPDGGWVAVGDATIGPGGAAGRCGAASWSLSFDACEPELRHLAPAWLYRTPLPRTKLTSPAPLARVSGVVRPEDGAALELDGWEAMIGHNWGAEHAERWIWLHGVGFDGQPRTWLDLALGRVRVGRRMAPWLASGALSLDGARRRLGGLGNRATVAERPDRCEVELAGRRGSRLRLEALAPENAIAGWRYADPDGSPHDVVNCSVAALTLELSLPGSPPRRLHTAFGGAYELGMRERDHGVPIAPFPDGES